MSVNWLQPLRPFVQQLGIIIDALDSDIQGYVDAWLNDHPEATTTVQDDSLTTAKYQDESITLAKLNADVLEYIATHGVDAHGYYPYMLVGGADALTSGAVDESTWTQRVVDAPDGVARVESVKGNTVVWGQLIKLVTVYDSAAGVDLVINPATGYIELSGTASQSGGRNAYVATDILLKGGHKYLLRDTLNYAESGNTKSWTLSDVSGSHDFVATVPINAIYAYSGSDKTCWIGKNFDIGQVYDCSGYVSLFDLTQMFGAGNEPSTVAEFEQMFPEAYYPYSVPTLLSVNLAGIATTDADGNALDERTWDAVTLRKAGSVADMLYSDHKVTNIGVADADSTWNYGVSGPNTNGIYYITLSTGLTGSSFTTNIASNIPISTNVFSEATQREFACNTGTLFYRFPAESAPTMDDAIADLRTNNVVCFYPTSPTTVTIDPPLNLTYRTAEGGTEEIVVPDNTISAPPEMSVVYPKIINGDALTAQLIRPNLGNEVIDVPVTLEPAIIGDFEIEPEIEEVQTDDIEEG